MTAQETPGLTTRALEGAERGDVGQEANAALQTPHSAPRLWALTIPAPYVKPVTKRKTGKVVQRKPWLNSNDRDHFRTTAPITKNWRLSASLLARAAGLPTGLAKVRIDAQIHKPRAGRYDAMNYYPTLKAIVDGLTDYGLTTDDSNEYVEGPYITAGDKAPNAVTLTIKEIK